MARLFGPRRDAFRLFRRYGWCVRSGAMRLMPHRSDLGGGLFRFRRRWDPCDFLNRTGDAAHERAKIGEIDQREQQSRNPEGVDMREQREQSQYGNDLELN